MQNKNQKNATRNIFISTAGHFIIDLYPAFIIGLIPLLTLKFSLSVFQVSILTGVAQISNSITQPFFGILSDRHGIKKYMTSGLLVAAFFISFIALLPNYFLILLFLFIGNLGVAAFHPPSAAIGAQYTGKKKSLGNSIISFGGTAGYALGSVFFVAIIEKAGIKFSPLAMLPGIFMAFFLIKKFQFSNIPHKNPQFKPGLKTLFKIKKAKLLSIFLIWIAAFSRDVLWLALLTFIPIYFSRNSINALHISFIITCFGFAGGFGGMFASYFTDRFKRHTLIQIAYLFVIPLVFLIFKTPVLTGALLFIISGFFLISSIPLCLSISHDLFPGNLSLASSLVIGFSAGLAALTGMLLGKIADKIGIQATLYIVLALLLIAIIAMFFVPFAGTRLKRSDN